jgi:hypothetical protein
MRAGRPRSQGFSATWGPGVPPAYSAAFFSWDRGRPARILRILSHLGTRRSRPHIPQHLGRENSRRLLLPFCAIRNVPSAAIALCAPP